MTVFIRHMVNGLRGMKIVLIAVTLMAPMSSSARSQTTSQVTFDANSRSSQTLVMYGADSGRSYQTRLTTSDLKPFTSKEGMCFLSGTRGPGTGPSFDVLVLDNGQNGQWIVYVSGGAAKRFNDIDRAHKGYVKCFKW